MVHPVMSPAPGYRVSEMAERLLAERAVLQSSPERQAALRAKYEARVQRFEQKFGIVSESIHSAIERGELKETQEVGRWIMDYEILRRAREC